MDNIEYEVTGIEYTSDHEKFEPYNPLNRPEIKYKKVVFAIILFILILTGTLFVTKKVTTDMGVPSAGIFSVIAAFIAGAVYLLMISKKAVIWCVRVYQHYAPDHVRLRCAFEPSCSEYMILAVEKYGTFIGVAKGIKRLLRCHPPGGIDYP